MVIAGPPLTSLLNPYSNANHGRVRRERYCFLSWTLLSYALHFLFYSHPQLFVEIYEHIMGLIESLV